MNKINFYKDRICLNVVAKDLNNAQEIHKVTNGCVLIGILANQFGSVESAIEQATVYQKELNNAISIGLGSGDSHQWKRVIEISKAIQPPHINQVFSAVGQTRAKIENDWTLVNALVSPCGQIGKVKINTGPLSQQYPDALISIETAIAMIKEMGGNSIKYFPMKGLAYKQEYESIAIACAKYDMVLEPSGGLNLDNFAEIITIALQAGVKKVIPHVYNSIVDKDTNYTRIEDIKHLMSIIQKVVS